MYRDADSIEARFLGKINEIWKELCVQFGGENRILEAIEDL